MGRACLIHLKGITESQVVLGRTLLCEMESMMAEIFITIHPQFTETYQRVVLKYLQSPRALSKAEWTEVLTAFDLLSLCIVTREGKRQTFKRFYEEEKATSARCYHARIGME